MKTDAFIKWFGIGACLSFCFALPASGQVGPPSITPANTDHLSTNGAAGAFAAGASPDQGKPGTKAAGKIDHSAGVDEVLKMLQAGVSKDVIRIYIDNSPIVYTLSPADIITLKEHAVPDELTTAMLKRGATLMQQISQLRQPPPFSTAYRNTQLDPESYDYFQYYYLLPRTLAAANQRLFYPNAAFGDVSPYHYGFYGGFPFRAFPAPVGGLP